METYKVSPLETSLWQRIKPAVVMGASSLTLLALWLTILTVGTVLS